MPAKRAPTVIDPHAPAVVSLEDLRPNPQNPRAEWKPEQVEPFRASLRRFGDLSGVILNLTTGQLVGGHKRVEVFRDADPSTVQVLKTDQAIDAQGTVAHGFVIVDGARFAYREVRWSPRMESAANLAANRWGADWSWQPVAAILTDLQDDADLLALTGFPDHELKNLIAADWVPPTPGAIASGAPGGHSVRFTPEQFEIVQRVRAKLIAADDVPDDVTDARVIELVCAEFLSGA